MTLLVSEPYKKSVIPSVVFLILLCVSSGLAADARTAVDAFLSERLTAAANAEGSSSVAPNYDSASEDAPAIA